MRHPLVLMILTFVVWSGTFLLVYATQATGCSLGWHNDDIALWRSPLRPMLVVLVLAGLGATMGLFVWLRGRNTAASGSATTSFFRDIKTHVAVAAIFSSAFCFTGVFWLTLCAD
jgi:hypothetical protein